MIEVDRSTIEFENIIGLKVKDSEIVVGCCISRSNFSLRKKINFDSNFKTRGTSEAFCLLAFNALSLRYYSENLPCFPRPQSSELLLFSTQTFILLIYLLPEYLTSLDEFPILFCVGFSCTLNLSVVRLSK